MYLKEHKLRQKAMEQEQLNHFIHNEPYSCVASKVKDLLTKQWSEEPNAYVIMTKLSPRDETKVKNITG